MLNWLRMRHSSVLWIANTIKRPTTINWTNERTNYVKCQIISDTANTQKRRFSSRLDFWSVRFKFRVNSEFSSSTTQKRSWKWWWVDCKVAYSIDSWTAMKWSYKWEWQFWWCDERWQLHLLKKGLIELVSLVEHRPPFCDLMWLSAGINIYKIISAFFINCNRF